jgi:tetraacyldisaccharide 4'-kinase
LAGLFGVASAFRRWMYRSGLRRVERLPVRVIVVGNLIAGGAGKTPTVLALVRLLQSRGLAPAIVSRGYGGSASGPIEVQPATSAQVSGDEPLLLRRRAGVPVFVGTDRVAAVRTLLREHPGTDVVIADDGLQHHRLARDLQVLVFDERGVGNGWLLPAGPLREALPAAVPAGSIVLYNADRPTTPLSGWTTRRQLCGVVLLGDWWRGVKPGSDSLQTLQGRPLLAAAGTARPERFFGMLRAAGLTFDELPLPDHFDYAQLPWPDAAADVIVTEKDAIKLDPSRIGATRIWVAALDFVPDPGFDAEVMRRLETSVATA